MLEVQNLQMAYGGIQALRGVTLSVDEGAMVAIVGPNGAGKTTLLNTLSGLLRPTGGTVKFDGKSLVGVAAHRISRAGLIHVPEGRRMLGPMTVEENLVLGRHARGERRSESGDIDEVYALFPTLLRRRRQLAGSLSGGQQQMLAIGRALMGRPRILLLDEPSLGLSPIVTTEVFNALVALNAAGLTILLVEQNARRAFACTSYAYVLEKGTVVYQGESALLSKDEVIVQHYLGQYETNVTHLEQNP